jgi:hypothetical protein
MKKYMTTNISRRRIHMEAPPPGWPCAGAWAWRRRKRVFIFWVLLDC